MKRIALSNLTLHPENVRSRSPEEYAPESVADLVGSIAADGLFQNLVVQQIEGDQYGVLDGGRRLAGLQILAERGDLAPDAKIDCRVVPKSAIAVTAISIAANITQAPMKAIDQFDAFAKLIEDGLSVTDIAAKFGWTERGVRERLKYATIHPNIREAARQDIISLDTMKAFAAHPSMAVQLEVYEALSAEHELSSWKVRSNLKARGIKVGDAKAQAVLEAYRARGGAETTGLFPEDCTLDDPALIDALLTEQMQAIAQAEAERLGFAWAEGRPAMDWSEIHSLSRIYPTRVELEGAEAERAEAIAARLNEIEEQWNASTFEGDEEDADAECDRLSEELEELTYGYDPEEVSRAGVIAFWDGDSVRFEKGVVRKGDLAESSAEGASSDAPAAPPKPVGTDLAASLVSDLQTEYAEALQAALAADVDVAVDFGKFMLVAPIACTGFTRAYGTSEITCSAGSRTHGNDEERDDTAARALEEIKDGLELSWTEARSEAERFTRFQSLTAAQKDGLVAWAVAASITPTSPQSRAAPFTRALADQVLPNIREVWRPTRAFFKRLKTAELIQLLSELGLADEALRVASQTKGEIVTYLDTLFAEPATLLRGDQSTAVETWAPAMMVSNAAAVKDADATPITEVGSDADAMEDEPGEEAEDPEGEQADVEHGTHAQCDAVNAVSKIPKSGEVKFPTFRSR